VEDSEKIVPENGTKKEAIMKRFLVLFVATLLLLSTISPVMAWRGGHGGSRWIGPFVGGALIGGALGYRYAAPRYYPSYYPTAYYPPAYYPPPRIYYPPPQGCVGYDQWGRAIRMPCY
jgi:hypothetical protein